MKPKILINEIFKPQFIYNDLGLFSYLHTRDSDDNPLFPLLVDFITDDNYLLLDIDYLIGFSNEKSLSPLATRLFIIALQTNGFTYEDFINGLPDADLQNVIVSWMDSLSLGALINNRFGSKWKHLWIALNTAYNPLENYSMKETRTPDLKDVTDTDTTTETESDSGVYGFNSGIDNPSSKIKGTQDGTGKSTTTKTGTEKLERAGNIGVTTSQQMLQSEFEVRKYDFYKELFKDIDTLLCLQKY